MDQKLKEELDKGLASGKIALDNLKDIVKNITTRVLENSKGQSEGLKTASNELFHEVMKKLETVGKNSVEFIKAATEGIKEGIKDSSSEDKNLFKDLTSSLSESAKSFAEAGAYVTKETAKNIKSVIESLFKKKDQE